MRYLFLVLAFVLFSMGLQAQSAFAIQNSHKDGFSTQQISLANPWLGAKLSYNLNEDRPLDDNFLFNAKVLYTPVSGERYAFPIVANAGIGSGDIFNPDAGVNVGIYPYYILNNAQNFKVVLHGGLGYKVITDSVAVDQEAPQQIRLMGGLEFAFYSKTGGSPTTFSVTPAYLFNTLEDMDNVGVLEMDFVLPIANGLGLMASGQVPLNKQFDGTLRFGVIVNGQLAGQN